MVRSADDRLDDILERIDHIENLLAGKTRQDLASNPDACAAFERYLEIISEASRHVPAALKETEADIPWHDIANIGNHIRHGYAALSFTILWNVRDSGSLDQLRSAVLRIKSVLQR